MPHLLSFINEADQTFPIIGYLDLSLETSLSVIIFIRLQKFFTFLNKVDLLIPLDIWLTPEKVQMIRKWIK